MRAYRRDLLKILSFSIPGLVVSSPGRAAYWYEGAPAFDGDLRSYTPRLTPTETPNAPFLGPDGAEMTLSDRRGHVILVNFWATWCPPCVEEMPSLNRLQERLGGDHFEVVAISLDNPVTDSAPDVVEPFMATHGLDALGIYRTIEPQEMFKAFRLGALPTSLVLGPDGMTIGVLAGPADWSSPSAIALFEYLIENAPR